MEIKVLGICSSPVKEGNTEAFLREALKAAQEIPGVSTELISLRGKEIRDCLHCNWCVRKQEEGQFCNQHDDMYEIYPKLLEADALLLATPVYFTRLSGYMACFIDRLRCFVHGKVYRHMLKDKVGGALAVSWFRNTGPEMALLTLTTTFMTVDMIPVGSPLGAPGGAVGLSSEGGTGKFDPQDKLGVLKDEYGLKGARTLGKRVVEIARLIKLGKEALKAAAVA